MSPFDLPVATSATASLADPAGGDVLGGAVAWLEGTMLGTLATVVAVLAIAWLGFAMLAGRIDVRRAATVIVGCFVLFGASTIAAGIRAFASGGEEAYAAPPAPPVPPPPPPPAAPPPSDPYAGASVPQR